MKAKIKSFSRLSAAQKRVAIAKDVVAQIKAKQYKIATGIWLDVAHVELPVVSGVCQATLTGRVAQFTPPKCTCCALGAAMASSLRLFNVGEYESDPDFDELDDQLSRFFSGEQLSLIEGAFEQREVGLTKFTGGSASIKAVEKAGRFSDIDDEEKRALAIFNNIIKNNGTFKP